jgi:hypothetical protein
MINLNLLKAPFAPNDHEFDYDKNIYIKEFAITERLDLVCGVDGWALLYPQAPQMVTQTHWAVTAELSIKTDSGWVSRTNTGEGVTAIPKAMDWNDQRRVSNLAHQTVKKASTDALKRASRLWGIGRYLLNTPNNVQDIQGVTGWLLSSGLCYQLVGKSNWWELLKADSGVTAIYNHQNHLVNTLKQLGETHDLDTITYGAIRQLLIDRKSEQQVA